MLGVSCGYQPTGQYCKRDEPHNEGIKIAFEEQARSSHVAPFRQSALPRGFVHNLLNGRQEIFQNRPTAKIDLGIHLHA